MRQFLAVTQLPEAASEQSWRERLERVAEVALKLGIQPVETIFSPTRGQAFSLFEARDEASVRLAHERAGLGEPDVFPAEQIFTELLHEARRNR